MSLVKGSDGEEEGSGAAENRPTKVLLMQDQLDWVSHLLMDVATYLMGCCLIL